MPAQGKSHDPPSVRADTEHDNDAARLVFPQKAAGDTADNQTRHLFLEFLHMNACAIARVSLDEYPASAHGVADGVADATVNHDLAVVHGIAHRILGIAPHDHRGAVEIRPQRVARNAFHLEYALLHARREKTLSEASFHYAAFFVLSQQSVQSPAVKAVRLDNLHGPDPSSLMSPSSGAPAREVPRRTRDAIAEIRRKPVTLPHELCRVWQARDC